MNLMSMIMLAQAKTFWLPDRASTAGESHDFIWNVVLYTTGFFFLLVVTLMVTFIIKYRRRAGQPYRRAATHNTPLEIAWTMIPLIIVMIFFVLGLKHYVSLDTPPSDAYTIDVEATRWQFQFTYPNGGVSEHLYVPLGRPVRLRLTAPESPMAGGKPAVLHALYIPAFRVQKNAIPGRTVELWFQATELPPEQWDGKNYDHYFDIFCTQYCGDGHSQMAPPNHKVYVLRQGDFDAKLQQLANIFVDADKKPRSYRAVGESLYKSAGCVQCHSVDGTPGTGPTWKGLYKSDVPFSASNVAGYTLTKADPDDKWDAYLKESVLEPSAKIVAGYQPSMPDFASSFSGSPYKEKKLAAIIEYIKSLGDPADYKPMPTPDASTSSPAGGSSMNGEPTSPTTQPGK